MHYDTYKELISACDASPHGVEVVLSHWMPDGSERPTGFVSRTLSSTEQKKDGPRRKVWPVSGILILPGELLATVR